MNTSATVITDPRPAAAARQWDAAGGRLVQHQAAFEITDGLGRRPRVLDRSAYTESRAEVEELLSPLLQLTPARTLQIDVPGIEL